MPKIRINKLRGFVPERWADLKTKHYVALEGAASVFEKIAVFTGIPVADIENSKVDLTPIMDRIVALFSGKMEAQEPAPITLRGKLVKFPKKFKFTTFGQKAMVQQLLVGNEPIDIIAEVVAIYAMPEVIGHFDSKLVDELKKEVKELPALQIDGWCRFFLA